MEGFQYIDIFATKGLEYLLVILFLAVFTMVWWLLRQPTSPRASIPSRVTGGQVPVEWFRLSEDAYYHPGHTWARPRDGNTVRVGMDDFAQKLLGVADSITLPTPGTRIRQGGRGWRLDVRSRPIDLASPVSGEIVAVNPEVLASPELVNEDPYGRGWLFDVHVPDLKAVERNLLKGRFARSWMTETVNLVREHMAGQPASVMQDGGVPVSGFAFELAPGCWYEIVTEFLGTR